MDESRRTRWENATEWPLTAAALVFLVAYAWPILSPNLDSDWVRACWTVTWVTWALFVVDYVVRLSLSRHRWGYVRSNVLDLLAVILPILRPLRLLRLFTILSALNRRAGDSLRGRVVIYVVGSVALLLFVASLAVLEAERGHSGANINSYGDAVWWALTTVTTVGYGDRFPVTLEGRFVAGGLMLAGIALIGVVTASFASWLIERVTEAAEESQAATRRDVREVARQVEQLRAELAAQLGQPGDGQHRPD